MTPNVNCDCPYFDEDCLEDDVCCEDCTFYEDMLAEEGEDD